MKISVKGCLRSSLFKRLISIFIMVSFFTGPLISQVRFTDSGEQLICRTSSYSVTVSKSMFLVSVDNPEHQIIKMTGIVTDPAAGDNSWNITGCSSGNNKVRLDLMSQDGKYLSLLLVLEDNFVKVSINPADRTKSRKLGFKFDVNASGHWYGGDVVKAHLWPLEGVRLKVDPFYATSNQVSPVWLTSSGAGIFADTYSNMGYSFNDPVEGIFEIWAENQDNLDLKLVAGKNIRDAFLKMADITGKPFTTPPFDFFAFPQFYN
jgi:alpha-glucosidase (family GH31 glycosyl hydrolase)